VNEKWCPAGTISQNVQPSTKVADIRTPVRTLGCPCGCRTRLPYTDDEDCVRNQPVPEARRWGGYDAVTLGMGCSHDGLHCPTWRERHVA